jgi:hypothetical protein
MSYAHFYKDASYPLSSTQDIEMTKLDWELEYAKHPTHIPPHLSGLVCTEVFLTSPMQLAVVNA